MDILLYWMPPSFESWVQFEFLEFPLWWKEYWYLELFADSCLPMKVTTMLLWCLYPVYLTQNSLLQSLRLLILLKASFEFSRRLNFSKFYKGLECYFDDSREFPGVTAVRRQCSSVYGNFFWSSSYSISFDLSACERFDDVLWLDLSPLLDWFDLLS